MPYRTIVLILALAAASSVPVSVHASDLGKRVCAERKANQPAWQKEHYAFAMTANGEHCGWGHGYKKVNYAIHAALRWCKRNASMGEKKTCRIVYAK